MTREEINEEKQKEIFNEDRKAKIKKIIKWSIKAILIITILIGGFFTYNSYVATVKIKVREYRVVNSKIPESFNGIKIIQFSDLHYGSTMNEENLKDIKKLINDRKPDLIVFTGDLIDSNYKISEKQKELLSKRLKELNATLGKYAILGDEDSEEIITIYNQSDFTILKNEYELIYNEKNDPIILIGLDSLIEGRRSIDQAYSYFKQETYNSNIYTITIMHEPDSAIDLLGTYQTDLALAGHSHNGNIRIPIANIPLEKKEGAKKYNQDYYQIGSTDLYVSSGLGTNNKTGIRFFCRPSINFYRLSNK
ncbi:MAG: metallophosphoesterase [Clostridia bacterium]|nr:metallophosphoesterase [Clostridia bacterium]MBR6136997.1 metallophosphoesterase [Bacilli bacterium]